jgi:formiminotetrahydrofolate cyclodeaminase
VAGLTEGKRKFQAVHQQVAELRGRLSAAAAELLALAKEDAQAYQAVIGALGMPKETKDQQSSRADSIERATRQATEVPLRTARAAARALELLESVLTIGNPSARSDAAVGAQLAHAALKGAQYNVLINLSGLKDKDFAERSRAETIDLVRKSVLILERIDARMTA